jgi:tRNA(fMet)-specific endonuclease VapC
MEIILDTNFVITAEREARRGEQGRADAFLEKHAADVLYLTFTVAGELACGQSASAKVLWRKLIHPYVILPWVEDISFEYGVLYRELAGLGALIGTNDLWIAATARFHGMTLVTDNLNEFKRVDGLALLDF